ncbi:MAG TPA: T9SS C-terminal target domain-containing protein, partial [Saprospiraceae bacterium]|nr:T9SS C-terminal target domain-containing protein [Saprospiraceae bacterium]
MVKSVVIFGYVFLSTLVYGQSVPFDIIIEPFQIDGLGGIQSYAFGQHNNKWLMVGGRIDGLHRRQPFASFDIAGNNNQIIVVDPIEKKHWSTPINNLPISIQEQLSSTNMQFYQEGDYLYCIGGYGFSPSINNHTTYPYLTAIKVSDVIDAVISKKSFSSYFRQITDPIFQVTGGKLKKINNDFYLLGGQKFIGRYNPMGPNNGTGFIQEYTNAITKFAIMDNGEKISIKYINTYIDSTNLHRRDYNAKAQILPSGAEGITMFSGVFQPNVYLPFLNSVTVDSSSYAVYKQFQQYYNHYHSA